jgi:small subunit ribosomal protein S8
MPVTDPIGDMLTRIRNGSRAHKAEVVMPRSKLKLQIAEVLKSEGYIKDVHQHQNGIQGEITVVLRYDHDGTPAFTHVKRVSKPGLRRYVGYEQLTKVLGGLGGHVLSTPKGILTDREARKQKVGGELICSIW